MELIKIQKSEGGNDVISAKELFIFLGYDKSHWKRWHETNIVNNTFAIENQDYQGFATMANGNETKDYLITLDFAKRLSMMAKTEKGETARKYFIECEKKLKEVSTPKELSRKEILLLALEAEERAEKAEKTLAILTHVNKNYTITEIAKELNLKSGNELNKILVDLKVQYKQNDTWVLYSKYSNLGYVDIKQEVLDTGKVIYHRKITQLGREFILKLVSEYKNK